jgi:hypothetical protein
VGGLRTVTWNDCGLLRGGQVLGHHKDFIGDVIIEFV